MLRVEPGRHFVVIKGVAEFWSASGFSMFFRYVDPER